MEALSGAASGIAVISLSIQLIQSVALITEFIENVKGASKELDRLVSKLELLNALLEDARKILEQQSSLLQTHFPAPSMAIFKCLQGCEKSIQPLVDIVKKLTLPQSQPISATARLKSEIKLGLKAKELTTLETRIQHDIDLLTTSLSLNHSGIFMSLFPMLLRNQETMLKSHTNPPVASVSYSGSGLTATTLDTVSSSAPSPVRYSQQTILVRSAFERLGLYRRKVIRYQNWEIKDLEGNVKSCKKDILWTADELSAMWVFLGFGLTFTQQHPYGRIFPSLSTYPVGELSKELWEVLSYGSVQQLQKSISTGALHPFLRSPRGYSLLHYAVLAERPDMCRLFLGHGVKPELTSDNQSPLSMAIECSGMWGSSADTIDTYRCFFYDVDLVDEFNKTQSRVNGTYLEFGINELEWLWQKNLELLAGEDLRNNQRIIISWSWTVFVSEYWLYCEFKFPDISMDRDILNDIQHGRCHLFQDLFGACKKVTSSYVVGARFLDWLVHLDLDPELCVASERAHLERSQRIGNKRIVFERIWEQKWVLGFEWVVNRQAPGYTLLSEYTALTADSINHFDWPFDTGFGWLKRNMNVRSELFNRRMAAKERKERARLGKRQPRSRMPGAWKW